MYTEGVLAGRNLIEDQRSNATGVGVMLKDVEDVRIAENVIARNRVGLKADGTHRAAGKEASILRNRFDSNDTAVSLFPSADLGFGANTFEGNLTDVHADDRGVARRNDWTFEGTGNRWSSYAGYDLDADGVGDVPHSASGALQLILSDVPALQLYRGSPALRALDSAQELWESDRAVVMSDRAPRIGDYAPSARDLDPEAVQAASVSGEAGGWYAVGVTLAMLALLGMVAARLRRKGARA
jgi:nitrous oxidase accessory protein